MKLQSIFRPHQFDFLFHGSAGLKKLIAYKKGGKAHVINTFSFIVLHNNDDGVIGCI